MAVDLLEKARSVPSVKLDRELALAHHGMGETLRKLDDIEGAELHLRKAIQIRAAPTQLDPDQKAELAASHYALGALLAGFTDRFDEARAEYRAAIDLLVSGRRDFSTEARYKDNLGRLELSLGRVEEASELFEESAKILELRTDGKPENRLPPGVRWQLARVSNNRGSIVPRREGARGWPKAILLLEKSRERLDLLTDEFPQVEPYRQELAIAEGNLASIALEDARTAFGDWARYQEAGSADKAQAALDRAESSLKKAILDFNGCLGHLEPPTSAGFTPGFREDTLSSRIVSLLPVLGPAKKPTGPPSKQGDAPPDQPISSEVEWPRLITRAELHVAEAWAGGLEADLGPIDADLRLMEALISRLAVANKRVGLPQHHRALAGLHHAKYETADFILANFAPNLEKEKVAAWRKLGREALDAAIRHARLASDKPRLAEYLASSEKFDQLRGH